MKEFMLPVYNETDHQSAWPPERQLLKACESYIGKFQKDGKIKIAQPLAREGCIISGPCLVFHSIPQESEAVPHGASAAGTFRLPVARISGPEISAQPFLSRYIWWLRIYSRKIEISGRVPCKKDASDVNLRIHE